MLIGIQLHRQIDNKKLFCQCYRNYNNQDCTKLITYCTEPLKQKKYTYDSRICDYQKDEQPPLLNIDIVNKAIQLISQIPGVCLESVLKFTRKKILDGSLPSGYQRTGKLATGGYIDLESGKRVYLKEILLEEDSCSFKSTYYLSRLGVPLLEIVTLPESLSCEEVIDLVKRIQKIIGCFKNVPHTASAIRQDFNISLDGQNKVQIKGVSSLTDLKMVYEGQRQRQKHQKTKNNKKGFETRVFNNSSVWKSIPKRRTLWDRSLIETQVPLIPLEKIKRRRKSAQELVQGYKEHHQKALLNTTKNYSILLWLLRKKLTGQDIETWTYCYNTFKNPRVLFKKYLKGQLGPRGIKTKPLTPAMTYLDLNKKAKEISKNQFFKTYSLYFPRGYKYEKQ